MCGISWKKTKIACKYIKYHITNEPRFFFLTLSSLCGSVCRGGGGYSVERWVRGCAAQIGCIFSPTGFSMTPFYFKTRF